MGPCHGCSMRGAPVLSFIAGSLGGQESRLGDFVSLVTVDGNVSRVDLLSRNEDPFGNLVLCRAHGERQSQSCAKWNVKSFIGSF